MKLLTFLATLVLTPICFGMDASTIRDIAKKPHSRNGLLDQLEIYPDAREYEVTVRSGKSSETLVEGPKVMAAEKVVEGKYIVTEFQPPGAPAPFIMVVTYDVKEQVYRKWLLVPDGPVAEWIGTAVANTRMLSWISIDQQQEANQQILTSEVHTDDGTKWREIILDAGKVVGVIEGTARKTK
jgi:hypothetical protein